MELYCWDGGDMVYFTVNNDVPGLTSLVGK